MSYTNQDSSHTTGNTGTGTFDKHTRSADRFDNSSSNTQGGNNVARSNDPNNFSTFDNDSNNQSSNRDSSNAGSGYGSGQTGGNTDQYGAHSGRNMDNSGNTMGGAGEGFGAGTGTNFSKTDRDMSDGSGTYGNYTGDAGRQDAPPQGFRGGANDPAYQTGQHYDHKARGVVGDEGRDLSNTGVATGHHLPGHQGHHGINTDSTRASSTGMGSGMGNNNNDSHTFGQGQQARDTSSGYGNNNANSTSRSDNNNSSGYDNNTSSRTGNNNNTSSRLDNNTSSRYDSNNNNDYNTSNTGLDNSTSSNRFDNNNDNRGSNKANVNTDTYSGGAGGATTESGMKAIPEADAPSGIHASKKANTASGGGHGWEAGVTGLSAEEAKWVQQGQHAPSALDAHPNPREMDSYNN